MKHIYKYKLTKQFNQVLELPIGSKVLSVVGLQMQNIVVYAIVEIDPDSVCTELERYKVNITETGARCDDVDSNSFVGTVTLNEGQLVYHVFVEKSSPDN